MTSISNSSASKIRTEQISPLATLDMAGREQSGLPPVSISGRGGTGSSRREKRIKP